jgi:hypothetical protein
MQLTVRDIEILKFINEFGFCEMPQIEKRFSMKKPRCYQVMKRLIDGGFVAHQRVFHGRHGIFFLSRQGSTYTDWPPIRSIPKDNYIHQLTIIEVYFRLMQQHPDATWISERRINREKFRYTVGRRIDHLADGILVLPDDKEIAIEVELTMKSKKRLDDILWGYVLHKHIKEVWYYCSPDIVEKVIKVADNMGQVKIYALD